MSEVTLTFIPFDQGSILTSDEISQLRKVLISNKKVVDDNKDNYCQFLINSLPLLIDSLKSATGTGDLRIRCTDTLSIWILRANQLCIKNQEFAKGLENLMNVDVLNFLFGYVIDYLNETGAPLSNSLKDLMSKIVQLLKLYHNSQEILKLWLDKTLMIPKERRVLYYLIEILSKEIDDPEYIVSKDPLFIENSLKFINSNSIGNGVGHAIAAVYQKLYVNEDHAEQWFHTYWTPIKKALHDQELKKGMKKNLLPGLMKISKVAFKLLIVDFSENDPEFYIHLLNIGQQLVIEEDPFPEILSYEQIENLLIQDSYKVEIFRLLTYSPKGSKPVHPEIFQILQSNMTQFFSDVEVETRNQFLSMLKQFIYRVKDSAYAQDRDGKKWLKRGYEEQAQPLLAQAAIAKSFIQWLLSYIKSQLTPGSQYQRVISALTVLTYLVESNLDPSIPFKVSINYPFQLDIFDDELTRLLVDTILSTYDDIRDLSTKLLLLSAKFNLEVDQKQRLIQRGFDMLNDYTTCDSGAKLLELSYTLFDQDISIFNRLLQEIPLNDNIFEAVRNPIDGYFNALALILKHLKTYDEPSKIIEISTKNWENVKEILSHDSPEGCDQYGVGSAQLVLSYGWRSTKESTILINELLLRFGNNLTEDQLLQIGELTLDQLSTVRHRGAFSSVYPTFITLSSVAKDKLPGQNMKWLESNIALIQTKTQLITRRSGGLPYLITAIVTVERDLFQVAFDNLLQIAQIPVDEQEESEKMDIPQVHAFNCIKHLFIESQLSLTCAPFIYKGLELSLSTFSSKIWSVRNCSIMLFTALQNRLFARKKMSARVFFSRFKGIKEILVNILENSIKDGNLETLFPVLTVLSKLEATPGYTGLEEFKPLLRSCLKTKFWKIRESASRALPALISNETEEANFLLDLCSLQDQNQLHGHLLAIRVLGCYTGEFVNKFYSRVYELLVKNPCFSTRKCYLQIIGDIFAVHGKQEQLLEIFKGLFVQDNAAYEVDGSKQLYLQDLARLVIQYDHSEEILEIALKSEYYEVKIEAIEDIASNNIHSHDQQLEAIAKSNKEWTYVRSKAIPLVDNYPISKLFEFATDQKLYGEDIKRSALELLGAVIPKEESSENFMRFFELLKLNSHEDEPFPIRFSALKSALKYLSIQDNINIKWIVYEFLSDDDEEVRELAADFFNRGCTAHSIANSVVNNHFGSDVRCLNILKDQLLSFKPDFQSAGGLESKVLFIVEKGNFYRNNIEQHIQLAKMIKLQWVNFNDFQKTQIQHHLEELVIKLAQFIKIQGYDGFLGWSTNESIFGNIFGVLFHAKSLAGTVDTTAVKEAVQGVEFHQTLAKLLV